MRYKNQPIEKPQPRVHPIVREPAWDNEGNKIDKNIYFLIHVVYDFSDFDKLCPLPSAPFKTLPGGISSQNVEDPSFKLAVEARNQKRLHWMFLKAVEQTDGLQWETVDMGNPETWSNYEQELRDAGLNRTEIQSLLNEVYLHNSIDEEKVEEARKSFLATLGKRNAS